MKKFKTTFMVALMLMTTFVSVQPLYAETRTHEDCNLIAKERSEILDIEQEAEKDKQERYLGEFEISWYCNCKICCGKWSGGACKDGSMPKDDWTIAVDPKVIPLGSLVEIDDYTYKACDTGSYIVGRRIDIYCSSHNQCLKNGRKFGIKVYKAKEDGDKFEM